MTLFSQDEVDQISDTLKRVTTSRRKLPETLIAGWFFNEPDGPQFWLGSPPHMGMQPLYYDPARDGQEPVAWRAGEHITQDLSLYRTDIDWRPLYLAR